MHNPTRRKVLRLLSTRRNGVRYQTLFDGLNVSERWIRSLIADLREDGIVETPGNPALIRFTSEKIELAIKEILAFLDSDWIEAITDKREAMTALTTASSSQSLSQVEDYLKTMSSILRQPGG